MAGVVFLLCPVQSLRDSGLDRQGSGWLSCSSLTAAHSGEELV